MTFRFLRTKFRDLSFRLFHIKNVLIQKYSFLLAVIPSIVIHKQLYFVNGLYTHVIVGMSSYDLNVFRDVQMNHRCVIAVNVFKGTAFPPIPHNSIFHLILDMMSKR